MRVTNYTDLIGAIRENKVTEVEATQIQENLTNAQARELEEALAQNTVIKALNLRYSRLGMEGAKALSNGLRNTKTLHRLKIYNAEMGVEGVNRILKMMLQENLPPLKLTIGREVNDESISLIAQLLEQNKLKGIGLWGPIDSEQAKQIATALKNNHSLETLHISNASVGTEGAKAFAKVIGKHPSLTKVELTDNGIEEEGVIALANALKENPRIRTFYFYTNDVQGAGFRALVDAVKVSKSLQEVGLLGNPIGSEIQLLLNAANPYLLRCTADWGAIGENICKAPDGLLPQCSAFNAERKTAVIDILDSLLTRKADNRLPANTQVVAELYGRDSPILKEWIAKKYTSEQQKTLDTYLKNGIWKDLWKQQGIERMGQLPTETQAMIGTYVADPSREVKQSNRPLPAPGSVPFPKEGRPAAMSSSARAAAVDSPVSSSRPLPKLPVSAVGKLTAKKAAEKTAEKKGPKR
jgi:hypothetical protein